jgi:hypothetical protein
MKSIWQFSLGIYVEISTHPQPQQNPQQPIQSSQDEFIPKHSPSWDYDASID